MSLIAVVEYHSLLRRGLESLISGQPRLNLVAVVAEPSQIEQPWTQADVILFGPHPHAAPPLDETIGELADCGRVLLITRPADPGLVALALQSGAHGCVAEHTEEDELLRAVDTVAHGGIHIAAELAAGLRDELRKPPAVAPSTLARREVETLRWLAAGFTHSQIARRMDLTEATVSTYVKRIRSKLNVGNKADLTRRAIELGLLQEEPDPLVAGNSQRIRRIPSAAGDRRPPGTAGTAGGLSPSAGAVTLADRAG
ncbi:response regulator transcription factor [Streptomyces axinellae]|uniref:Response regulator transcription factor n=1 Tax=Streptomyces axinellae TaxID=552788 RepID=A0ABP6D7U4_9ACTN